MIFTEADIYFCGGVFDLVTSMLVSIRTMSWSPIPGSGLHLFTRLGCVGNTSYNNHPQGGF